MKKVMALVLALVLVLSLAACGGFGTSGKAVSLGDTASTDIVDFTMKDAKLSYYASAFEDSYAEPIDKSDGGIFTVAKGRVFVCMTFTIKNNDRDTLDVGDSFSDWKLDFKVRYNGKTYPLKAYDLNKKDGDTFGMSLRYHAESTDGGITWKKNDNSNAIIGAGSSGTIRVVEVAGFDPDSLNDPFEITVNIPTSNDKYEYYTYEVK